MDRAIYVYNRGSVRQQLKLKKHAEECRKRLNSEHRAAPALSLKSSLVPRREWRLRARDMFSVAQSAFQPAIPHDDAPAHHRRDRPARHLKPFVRRIVGSAVQDRLPDGRLTVGIPDGDIGVAPTAIVPFAGIEGRTSSRGSSPSTQRTWLSVDAPLLHALREQDRQPRFDAGNAVRHPAESWCAVRRELALRVVVAERAVIRREHLEHAGLGCRASTPPGSLRHAAAGCTRTSRLPC